MLAPLSTKIFPDLVEGQAHRFECEDCEGSGRDVFTFNGGQDEKDLGDCQSCDGNGHRDEPASAEDCKCGTCTTGFWFWSSPIGDRDAQHYETLTGALRAGAGEITKRVLVMGHYQHQLVAVQE